MAALCSLKSQPLCLAEIENTLAPRGSFLGESETEVFHALVSTSSQQRLVDFVFRNSLREIYMVFNPDITP